MQKNLQTINVRLVKAMFDSGKLALLVKKFNENISYYKDGKNTYNEHQCRIEYIDPFLRLLGWDVSNEKGLAPQYREIIGENYSTQSDRPDYTLTLRGVSKMFVEAKKPSVDILNGTAPAFQCRKYGWNAKHSLSILTNFEYFIIYNTTFVPKDGENSSIARYRTYHYTEFVDKFSEMASLVSRDAVYSGDFENMVSEHFITQGSQKQQVDELFLNQINEWRVALSNELFNKNDKYKSLERLNDVVQSFINKIVFLRICEDKNLPVYYKLEETISDPLQLLKRLEELFRAADKKYNSGIFTGENIVFDLNNSVIIDMIKSLYYPQSPYMFNIIEPNLLGKIYELFLTQQLSMAEGDTIVLTLKTDCVNRSVVTTPTEIVKYMIEETLSRICVDKTPTQVLDLKISDIACGSGVFLEEVFAYLQMHCVNWYMEHDISHLVELNNGKYKLPLDEKKNLLTSCVYGIDIDIHAVEVAKFSLLVKLIEEETTPSVQGVTPILPDLSKNIFYGNALVSNDDISDKPLTDDELIAVAPLDWEMVLQEPFDVIIGNPPYVSTEGLHALLPKVEFEIYKKNYKSTHKQFDKYFVFVEQALKKVKPEGYVCYIIPNKFFKIGAGEKLRELIAKNKVLVKMDDFGDTQLFEDKTIYCAIILLQTKSQSEFKYSHVQSAESLWIGDNINYIDLKSNLLNKLPWRLTTDIEFLKLLEELDKVAVPLSKHANIFNGIQTSAERPTPIYWFSTDEVINETEEYCEVKRDEQLFRIEKSILRPYFKPTKKNEKGLNSYSYLGTDKRIIFPYDSDGVLIPLETMNSTYPEAYRFLQHYYDRLVPKCVSSKGIRDVPNATEDTWYQYGRTQALKAFTNTPKLIVGILSRDAMYAYDKNDMLIASGGTAGYCAISKKDDSPYALEYIQAWLSHPITEKIISIVGSDFEGGFVSRGTFILPTMPFVELNLKINGQKELHDKVVSLSKEIYIINDTLTTSPTKRVEEVMNRKKKSIIKTIESIIEQIYNLNF